ncbi:FRG domain-containing protein [Sphingobacterium thalpophilum]|uniref:FRG domain n=1 Tax=Sphingobacterium thalpophilum TaxID=259 RepID=A0A4U9VA78_9SPHI|nr:FRG domain-containing protein [Sphingobacterium thalpophilum]VTR43675.1 FRG domain [Sphingobacterium thalpophilum]
MDRKTISSFIDFINHLDAVEMSGYEINLFRGQSHNHPLLPSICRKNSSKDTTELERDMLSDFKRRSSLLIKKEFTTDWEWLVYAQHFGLKTRLLDWTSNPLIALWFACQNLNNIHDDAYLYIFSCDNNMRVDIDKKTSPFEIRSTKILKPMLNNERIVAQYGWFTAHAYSRSAGRFVKLETNKKAKKHLTEIKIPASLKKKILRKLSVFGINSGSVYPDINGLSLNLNWEYLEEKH